MSDITEVSVRRLKNGRKVANHLAEASSVALGACLLAEWLLPGSYLPEHLILTLTSVAAVSWACYVMTWCACHILRILAAQAAEAVDRAKADYYLGLIKGGQEDPGPDTRRRRLFPMD